MNLEILQLFAEGGTSGEGAEGVADAQNASVDEVVEESNPDAEFDELISEKYKDQFEKRLKSAMDRRFKKADEATKYNEKAKALVDELGVRYGITDGNIDTILEKFRDDETNYEQEALDKGIPVEVVKQMRQLESQNRQLTMARQEAYEEQRRRAEFEKITNDANLVKQTYPSFNLEAELNNPAFVSMLRNGVEMKNAYEVLHLNEIMGSTIPYAIDKATQKVANAVKANGKRALEGGAGNNAPMSINETHKSVESMTKEERAALMARAISGEKIRL